MIWRIRGRDAFGHLAREGTRIRGTSLWCTFLSDPSGSPPMVAFAIGRAVGPAATRNRLRRRLRALMAELDRVGGVPSGLLLIGARAAAVELTFDELRTELIDLMERLEPHPT